MRYTYKDFQKEYPDDDACLESVFQNRFGDLEYCPRCAAQTNFYRVKNRQCYACQWCSYQLFPLANTIFRKTTTPLTSWFHAIYLFSVAKNGVAAKELERHLGVTYKTAWRMAKQIRLLMKQETSMLSGVVEADETYIGGSIRGGRSHRLDNKTAVMGMTERKGDARAVVAHPDATAAKAFLKGNVEPGSTIHTDESRIYVQVKRDFIHEYVNHSKKQYVKGKIHTNSIEGFWGNMKNAISGTYHCVSPKYLQLYVDEFVFRYNFRDVAVCPVLLELASKRS